MTTNSTISPLLLAALKAADRKPGWNNRAPTIRRFTLGNCAVFVVPFRRWAYRRTDRAAANKQLQRTG